MGVVRYLSLFSGIEAATVAWSPLGWEPVAFAEVEPFPSAVLQHHYPDVPNLGDVEKIDGRRFRGEVDVVVGGSPCQAFSVAGLRGGVQDARGNLSLAAARLVADIRPKLYLWENVPGVLSSNQGRDFGSLLGALAELGYGFCWRVLDAQGFGLAQRRKRVFLVASAGGVCPREVLLDSASLPGNQASGGGAWETHPLFAATGVAGCDRQRPEPVVGRDISHALNAKGGTGRLDAQAETFVPSHWDDPRAPHPTLNQSHKGNGSPGYSNQELFSQRGGGLVPHPPVCMKVRGGADTWVDKRDGKTKGAGKGALMSEDKAFTLAVSQDQMLFQPIPFDRAQLTHPENRSNPQPGDPCHTLHTRDAPLVAGFNWQNGGGYGKARIGLGCSDEQSPPILRKQHPAVAGQLDQSTTPVQPRYRVRRLTPVECERLQGFPDGYTDIPWKGKPTSPDGHRYKALGNSMAVPVIRWIGERMQEYLSD